MAKYLHVIDAIQIHATPEMRDIIERDGVYKNLYNVEYHKGPAGYYAMVPVYPATTIQKAEEGDYALIENDKYIAIISRHDFEKNHKNIPNILWRNYQYNNLLSRIKVKK